MITQVALSAWNAGAGRILTESTLETKPLCVNRKFGENFEVKNICLHKQHSDSEPFG